MLTLYIVRHGETEWNKEGRIQGRLNSQLTDKGRQYARLLGERLKEVDFIEIISSPSSRTLETAKLICADRNLSIVTDEAIMEMDMGKWQGKTKKEIYEHSLEMYRTFMDHPEIYQQDGAETFADMKKRASEFLQKLQNRYLPGNLLIVTHGLFIKTLFLIAKEIEIKDFWSEPTVDGTSLSIVTIEQGKIKLVLEGDMGHVQEQSVRKSN